MATMMFTEWQANNCKMPALLRYCKWLLSQGKFDEDDLSLSRQHLIDRLKLYGYVEDRSNRWSMYG